MARLWQTLAVRVVDRLVPPDAVVLLDLDDTVFHKTGRSIDGAGTWRDAVRSTKKRVVHTLGLNLVVVTVRVAPPWGGMPVGLPVNVRLRRKDDDATTVDLARVMLHELAGWLPQRSFHVACDGAYASLCGAGLERVHITSRIRRDAAVYDLTPPRTGRRGRPRKKGDRLSSLPALAAAATDWVEATVDVRGTPVTRLLWSRPLLWYRVSKDTPPPAARGRVWGAWEETAATSGSFRMVRGQQGVDREAVHAGPQPRQAGGLTDPISSTDPSS